MKVSTKGRYALRLMVDLARHKQDGLVSLKDIAKRQQISLKYLEQIVVLLCKRGFLVSSRGAQGGYKLAKELAEYTVGDILRATEGDLAPTPCLENTGTCPRKEICKVLEFWKGLDRAVNEYLDGVTLADFVEQKHSVEKEIPIYIL